MENTTVEKHTPQEEQESKTFTRFNEWYNSHDTIQEVIRGFSKTGVPIDVVRVIACMSWDACIMARISRLEEQHE